MRTLLYCVVSISLFVSGVGPKTALKLIRDHKCIEEILKNLDDKKKEGIPDSWIPNEIRKREKKKMEEDGYDTEEENNRVKKNESEDEDDNEQVPVYVEARKLFMNHEVMTEGLNLKWEPCKAEELTAFLVDEMGFNAERVRSNIEKLNKAVQASAKPQLRMENFFKPKANPISSEKTAAKRKVEESKSKDSKKGKAASGFQKRR